MTDSLLSSTISTPYFFFLHNLLDTAVYDIIRRQYFGLKKEYERTLDLKFDLQKRIISPQRAISMAKNIFVGGNLKRLRATIRHYKKDEQRLAQNIVAVTQSEKIF